VGDLASYQVQTGCAVFTTREIDDLCEFILRRATETGADADSAVAALVARIARTHPQAPALGPVLPLAMAATALEAMIEDAADRHTAAARWRAAALIAAEVLGLQVQTGGAPTVSDLQARFGAGGAGDAAGG
jgi:hypothetical protein